MASIQEQIQKLQLEAAAIKASFEQSATQIPVHTKSLGFSTSRNKLTTHYPGGSQYEDSGVERVVVTFASVNGADTIATLEVSTDNPNQLNIRRSIYSGGAQWVVSARPKSENNSWSPTNYTFKVHSLIDGDLSAKDVQS